MTSEDTSIREVPDPDTLEKLTKPPSPPSKGLPPIIPAPDKYTPSPYTFRVPQNTVSLTSPNGMVRCPPFYIQLDHTLAVIWSLFSSEDNERPLGVVQLQWALSFLKGLHDRQGKYPADVAVCINAMEEALLLHYAEMTVSVKHDKPLGYSGDFEEEEPVLVTQRLPFSVNYAEMSKFKPNRLEQLFATEHGVSMTDVDIERELDKLKHAVSEHVSEGNLKGDDKENMVEFLKTFRREQISKIQEELKRLHSIETFIGNIDKDNFEPYLNDKQLEVLYAKRNLKE